jgi:hypothetical protein
VDEVVDEVVTLLELHVEAEVAGVQAGFEHLVEVPAGVPAEAVGDLHALALAGGPAVHDCDGVGLVGDLVPSLAVEVLEVVGEDDVFGRPGHLRCRRARNPGGGDEQAGERQHQAAHGSSGQRFTTEITESKKAA